MKGFQHQTEITEGHGASAGLFLTRTTVCVTRSKGRPEIVTDNWRLYFIKNDDASWVLKCAVDFPNRANEREARASFDKSGSHLIVYYQVSRKSRKDD